MSSIADNYYRTLFEHSADAILLTAPDGRILAANPAACNMFGRSEAEICQLGRYGLVDAADPRVQLAVQERERSGKFSGEITHFRANGDSFPGEVSTEVFKDENGQLRTSMVIRDLTRQKQAERELLDREERYHTVADFTYDWEYWVDPGGKFEYVSPSCERITGYPAENFLENSDFLLDILHPADRQRVIEHACETILQGASEIEFRIIHGDGSTRWISHTCQPVYNPSGIYLGRRASNREITRRKKIQDALQESEAKYRSLFENSLVGISQALPDGRLIGANAAYAHMYGYESPEQILAEVTHIGYQLYANPQDREEVLRVLREKGVMPPREIAVVHRDGSQFFALVGAREIKDADGNLHYYQAEHVDITQRKQQELEMASLYEQVREGRGQLQILSQRLLQVQEDERRSIARELHDEIGQALTAIKIDLQIAQRAGKGGFDFSDSIQTIEQTLQQVRDLSLNLHPSLLDDLGLVPALRWLLSHQVWNTSVTTHFDTNLSDQRFEPDLEITCFRVAQEALTNVLRHAQASQVNMILWRHEDELHLVVRDDGIGFNVATSKLNAAQGESIGLISMQERVNLAGGLLEITSSVGQGSEVHVYLPVNRPVESVERRKKKR